MDSKKIVENLPKNAAVNEPIGADKGLPCIEKPGRYSISDGGSFWHVVSYKAGISRRLNSILMRYPVDAPFSSAEVLFKVPKQHPKLQAIRNALGIRGDYGQ